MPCHGSMPRIQLPGSIPPIRTRRH
jgi:hypothetical protein